MYDLFEKRPPRKVKISGRVENEIRRYYGQTGYWKQSIAMRLSYELGSLKAAWSTLKTTLSLMEIEKDQSKESDNWVELITQGLEQRLGKSVKASF